MTFETFLALDRPRSHSWRRITYAASLALHGALVVVGVAASFWRVDELSPPPIPVLFSPFLPAPPPPPPLGSRKASARPRPRTAAPAQPRPAVVPAPVEPPRESDGGPAGSETGVAGGQPDGVEGTQVDPPPPRFLAPLVAQAKLAIDPQVDPYRVRLPAALASAHVSLSALVKICVRATGVVDTVTVLRSNEPSLEATIVSVLRTWRYRPFSLDGRPVPFCSTVNYQITAL